MKQQRERAISKHYSNQKWLEFYQEKVAAGEPGLYTGHYIKQLAKYQDAVNRGQVSAP